MKRSGMIGKPHALKQVNLSLVRRAIKESGSATRGEIAEATQISGTTVRTVLCEMLETHEISEVGYDQSNGGRKAVRYRLNKDRFFGVALFLGTPEIRYLTVNVCGEAGERGAFPAGENNSDDVCTFLDGLVARLEIRAIGVGVPGVVAGMEYQCKNANGMLESHPIGALLHQRYGVPVILENDLNAATLGAGRRHQRRFPDKTNEMLHMAYIHFEPDCVSAGFLSDGRILHGRNNFVGELGFFPTEECGTLGPLLGSPMEDERYADIVAKMLAGVCCVLNPEYITLGGEAFHRECLPLIARRFATALPQKMTAELACAQDIWQDYYEGMAALTAEQIFAEVRLIKERG